MQVLIKADLILDKIRNSFSASRVDVLAIDKSVDKTEIIESEFEYLSPSRTEGNIELIVIKRKLVLMNILNLKV